MYITCILAVIALASSTCARDQKNLLVDAVSDIPLLGFGTWNVQRTNASDVISAALETGYRHLDCAAIYGNEKEVGEGIASGLKNAGISRSDIWITSKLWNDHHAPEDVTTALNRTLSDLNLDYVDLYLMHWPVAKSDGQTIIDFIDTWKAMTKLPTDRARRVGISNFSPSQLQAILDAVPHRLPYAHQMEMHPYLPQEDFLQLHTKHQIHVTAYSPLGSTNPTYGSSRKDKSAAAVPPLLKSPLLREIAANVGCTPAQAALAWGMIRGTSVIPKSVHRDRMEENFAAPTCKLAESDVRRLEVDLPVKRFNNPSKNWGVSLFDGLEDSSTSDGDEVTAILEQPMRRIKTLTIVLATRLRQALGGWATDL